MIEVPPHDPVPNERAEAEAPAAELTPEQLKDIEHDEMIKAEQWQAAKVAAEAADAEKLAELRKKLNLETSKELETEDEPIPVNKYEDLPKENTETIEDNLITWEDVTAPMDLEAELENHLEPLGHEGMAGVNLEELRQHSEEHEKMREGVEHHVEGLGEKAVGERAKFTKVREAQKKKEKTIESLKSAGTSALVGVGSLSAAALLGYGAASYFAATPVFSAAAGLAGFSGLAAVGGAALGLWFGVIAIQEFFKAGGFKALFSSKGGGGGGHAAPKKPAGGGGGGAHH